MVLLPVKVVLSIRQYYSLTSFPAQSLMRVIYLLDYAHQITLRIYLNVEIGRRQERKSEYTVWVYEYT